MVNEAKLVFRILSFPCQHCIPCPYFLEAYHCLHALTPYSVSLHMHRIHTHTHSLSFWDSSDVRLNLVSYFQPFRPIHNCCLESCVEKDWFQDYSSEDGKDCRGQMEISDMNAGLGSARLSGLSCDHFTKELDICVRSWQLTNLKKKSPLMDWERLSPCFSFLFRLP